MKTQWMAILAGLALVGGGCGKPGSEAQDATSVQVSASASALTVIAPTDFEVSVACGDRYGASRIPLARGADDGKLFDAVFGGVPVDVDCTFSAVAFEQRRKPAFAADYDVRFEASVTHRFARGEKNPKVTLMLEQKDHVTTSENHAPRIVGLTASDNSVDLFTGMKFNPLTLRDQFLENTDSIVVLNAKVADADADPLWFRYQDCGLNGTFVKLDWDHLGASLLFDDAIDGEWIPVPSSRKIPTVAWIPPANTAGRCVITLTIKDRHTGEGPGAETVNSYSKLAFDVEVGAANAKRVVTFRGDINHAPDVFSLATSVDGSTGGQVIPGEPARLVAKIHDYDRDALDVTWTSEDCPGVFKDAAGNVLQFPIRAALDGDKLAVVTAFFVPAAAPADGVCEIELELDDRKAGGETEAEEYVNVVAERPVAFGPDLQLAYASAGTVGRGTTVNFRVDARSRYGSPSLTYRMELLSPWLSPEKVSTFGGARTNTTGEFSWTTASGLFACGVDWVTNFGETYYFLFTITDEAAVANGVPAVNYVVLPIEVECLR